jgi:ABC-type Zn uptake system ZnuABC Zn-binding protein ZnuA
MTIFLPVLLAGVLAGPPSNPIRVVTSLSTFASIAREVTGDRAIVTSIAEGDEDPHFVQPRPSFVPLLRDADLFVTSGMDLELWVSALLDRAGNGKVRVGGVGYVAGSQGVHILEVPTSLSRSEGDIHVDGNPHIQTDPINGVIIARNILAGLQRVDPANGEYYAGREHDFEERLLKALYGDELVRILTPATLLDLARNGREMAFFQRTNYQGRPLITRLGGWMQQIAPIRTAEMVCYHKEWVYLTERFGPSCVEYLEPKPGIPPTPRHVQEVIALMRERHIRVLFSANFYDRSQIREIAQRTNGTAVIVPANTRGAPGVETYFDLVNTWVNGLVQGFTATPSGAP